MPDFNGLKKKLMDYASSGPSIKDAPMEGVEAESSPIDYLAAGAAPKISGSLAADIQPLLMNQVGALGERNLVKGAIQQGGLKGLKDVNVVKGAGQSLYDRTPTIVKGMEGPAEGPLSVGQQISGPSKPIYQYKPNYVTPAEQGFYSELKKKLDK